MRKTERRHCPSSRAPIEQLENRELLSGSAVEGPFLGTPFTVGQGVPAVDYDTGGAGVGYYVPSGGNSGGVNYRPGDAVSIQKGGSTGLIVCSTNAGEWLRYSFNVPVAGNYILEAAVANNTAGGQFQANFANVDATGVLTIPRTGGWQTYQTIQSPTFSLPAGPTVMTVLLDKNAPKTVVGNFDWFKLVAPGSSNVSTPPPTVSWNKVANNPLAIAEAQGAVVNGKLYVIGGHIEVGQNWIGVSQTDVYNPTTNTWQQLASAPQRLSEAAVATYGQYIYVAGGYVSDSLGNQTFATTNVWRYDTVANVWQPFVPLPQPRGAGALVLLGTTLHYFGGSNLARVDQTNHWELDLSSASPQWVAAAPLPADRNRMGAVALNGEIYSIGGQTGYDSNAIPRSNVYVWNPQNPGVWTTAASLPTPESHLGAAAITIDGMIVVVGGDNTVNHFLSNVTAYDPATNTWASLTPIPQPRMAVVAGVIGNEMIVTTGYNNAMSTTTWCSNPIS